MTIDFKIRDESLQYDINREAAKDSPLRKAFEKQRKIIKDQGEKQTKTIVKQGKKQVEALEALKSEGNKGEIKLVEELFPKE